MSTFMFSALHCCGVFRFDILANGGGSVTLHFQRKPFQSRRVTVFVPWNRIMVMDVVTMTLDGSSASAADADDERDASGCDMANIQHDYYSLRPTVVSLWRDSHLPSCSSVATSLIPETQVHISSSVHSFSAYITITSSLQIKRNQKLKK